MPELTAHLRGEITLDEAAERAVRVTVQYAKRQATWFRGLAEVRPWPVPSDEPAAATAERLARGLGQAE